MCLLGINICLCIGNPFCKKCIKCQNTVLKNNYYLIYCFTFQPKGFTKLPSIFLIITQLVLAFFSPRTLAGIGSSRLIRTSEMLFRRGVTHRKNFLIYSSGRKFSQIRREDQLEHSLDSFDKKQKIFNEVFASLHWTYFLVFFLFCTMQIDFCLILNNLCYLILSDDTPLFFLHFPLLFYNTIVFCCCCSCCDFFDFFFNIYIHTYIF